jgi:hypothetical protein
MFYHVVKIRSEGRPFSPLLFPIFQIYFFPWLYCGGFQPAVKIYMGRLQCSHDGTGPKSDDKMCRQTEVQRVKKLLVKNE